MANSLEKLKKYTTVVSDTGDIDSIAKYKPQDATTNPSLLYAAAQMPQYAHLVDDAVKFGKLQSKDGKITNEQVEATLDKLAVNFGVEILKIVPGRVSTEIDARLSFDTEQTVARAKQIINLYKEAGIDKERILLKIASTWEGIQAAKQLEQEGLHCNMTLLFSLTQAAACAEAGATLISPFAGRITDFFKQKEGKESFPPKEDPGVISVQNIYRYYKFHGYKTVVMGASFRSKEQVIELCGCDLLTVAPALLEQLSNSDAEVSQVLKAEDPGKDVPQKLNSDEKTFRWELNENEMADFKTSEGIRKFAIDLVKLENEIRNKLAQ